MKNLKRLFFIISIFAIFNISAFAKSGLEFILNVPIGASYSIISENMKEYYKSKREQKKKADEAGMTEWENATIFLLFLPQK